MRLRIALRMLSLGGLSLGAFALTGCLYPHGHGRSERVVVVEHEHGGPPPHAPAHGYRRKHGYHHTQSHKRPEPRPHVEVALRWDDSLGVHVVVGHEGIYFHADHYYRLADTGWEWSASLGHSWSVAPDHGVPTGLRQLHKAKHKKKRKKGKDAHPARGPHSRSQPAEPAPSHASVAPPPKVKAVEKSQAALDPEDEALEHRHKHNEHGRGWN